MTNTTTLPQKSQMKVYDGRKTRLINCFPSERQFMAELARNLRKWHRSHWDTKPTLQDIRYRAAERYL
jgi:hypothetical protein